MKRFGLKADDVLGHNEFSGHGSNSCPGISMNTVRSRLKGDASGGGSTATPAPSTPNYTVKAWNISQVVSTDILNVRAAQNTSSKVLRQLKRDDRCNATRITRNGENVNGYTIWFEAGCGDWVSGALVTPVSTNAATSVPPSNVWHSHSGTVTVTTAAEIKLRGTSTSDTTNPTGLGAFALLKRGQQVKYDRVLVQRNGHAFVR
ncbi:hypothetical protein D922_02414 [Enterococcus faecalis 06-MB-DW-09]|nr:hypothetical protein D922_02414 [Enterococcus faecalis 06-MB-DW-09]